MIVIPTDSLGGAEQVLKMIATHHNNENVQIFFLSKKQEKCLWDSDEYQLEYANSTNRFRAIFKLSQYILNNKVNTWDLVLSSHTNITGLLGILIRIGFLKKKKFIARESTTVFQRFSGLKLFEYKLMYKFGYKCVDLLVCQTNDMRSKLDKAMPFLVSKTKIVTINNPINLVSLKQVDEFVSHNKYIVSAGRFIDAKAYDILISAFKIINETHNDYHLLILGEGDLKNNMVKQCEELGIISKVHMPGRVDNVLPFFKNAEVCVVSSRMEGFPNVLLQMMSQNTKVVSTLCAGGIGDLEGVITVEIDNPEELAKAVIKSIESDTENNRTLFDKELHSRDISKFMSKLQGHCGYLHN